MSQNTHQNVELFSKTTRGRKSRTISKVLDFTGRDPVMVVNDLQNATTNYKEEVNIVNNGTKREEFRHMSAKQLRYYAELFATKVHEMNHVD
ncbi:4755_t:CDS:2 [Paraglomus brasilianum]|uniref:4755_t:CDS:1 n=1 Tax=Paraglomus brasilianum TaxID=144538 RepID=A0A9N9DKE4_9GLOM|nr:4755_t:CDS:2 [Paraglomus brasilianum]